jgi:hypothetical protein
MVKILYDKWWLKYGSGSSYLKRAHEDFLRTMTEQEFANIPMYLQLGIPRIRVADGCEFWFYYKEHKNWPTLSVARELVNKN